MPIACLQHRVASAGKKVPLTGSEGLGFTPPPRSRLCFELVEDAMGDAAIWLAARSAISRRGPQKYTGVAPSSGSLAVATTVRAAADGAGAVLGMCRVRRKQRPTMPSPRSRKRIVSPNAAFRCSADQHGLADDLALDARPWIASPARSSGKLCEMRAGACPGRPTRPAFSCWRADLGLRRVTPPSRTPMTSSPLINR